MYLFAVIAITFTACKNEAKSNSDASHSKEMNKEMEEHHHDGDHDHNGMNDDTMMSENRDITQTNQKNEATTPIIDAYLKIKNALVKDDKVGAANGAEELLKAFENFDMTKLTPDQHKEYMEILEEAKEQAEHIVKSPIDHQREHFATLSTDIHDMITLLGTNKTLYVDYCPMVKESWLSETKNITNPYYGAKMLTCGGVKKQIN